MTDRQQKLLDAAAERPTFGARQSFAHDTYLPKGFSVFIERQLARDFICGLMPAKKPGLVVWPATDTVPTPTRWTSNRIRSAASRCRRRCPTRNRFVNRLLFEFDRDNGFAPDLPDWQAPALTPKPLPDAPKAAVSIPQAPADIRSPEMRSIAVGCRSSARRKFAKAMINSVTGLFRQT